MGCAEFQYVYPLQALKRFQPCSVGRHIVVAVVKGHLYEACELVEVQFPLRPLYFCQLVTAE